MTLPRSVADVLDRHVTFEIESIDRMYCNVYQPLLQYPRGAATFFSHHRGHAFASSALMAPMTKAFVTSIQQFVDRHGLDLVHFAKNQRKDDLTQQYLAEHDGSEALGAEGWRPTKDRDGYRFWDSGDRMFAVPLGLSRLSRGIIFGVVRHVRWTPQRYAELWNATRPEGTEPFTPDSPHRPRPYPVEWTE